MDNFLKHCSKIDLRKEEEKIVRETDEFLLLQVLNQEQTRLKR